MTTTLPPALAEYQEAHQSGVLHTILTGHGVGLWQTLLPAAQRRAVAGNLFAAAELAASHLTACKQAMHDAIAAAVLLAPVASPAWHRDNRPPRYVREALGNVTTALMCSPVCDYEGIHAARNATPPTAVEWWANLREPYRQRLGNDLPAMIRMATKHLQGAVSTLFWIHEAISEVAIFRNPHNNLFAINLPVGAPEMQMFRLREGLSERLGDQAADIALVSGADIEFIGG